LSCTEPFSIVNTARLPRNHCFVDFQIKNKALQRHHVYFASLHILPSGCWRNKLQTARNDSILEIETFTFELTRCWEHVTNSHLSLTAHPFPPTDIRNCHHTWYSDLNGTKRLEAKIARCRLHDSLTVSTPLSAFSTTCCRHTCHSKWTGP
jgi:hypothetical protein